MSDGEEPGAHAAGLLIPVDRFQCADEDLVRGVLSTLGAAESDEAVAVDRVKVAVVERGERVPIAVGMRDEDGIGLAVGDGPFPQMEAAKRCAHGLALATTCVGIC